MPKIERLTERIEWIDLSFVERERTPDWAIQVGIRCHLAGMSLRDASQFLEDLGVQRSHVAIHDWVHKAELQPLSTVTADQLVVEGKMIRLHGQEFWLYGVVDRHTNEILHVRLFPTANKQTTRWLPRFKYCSRLTWRTPSGNSIPQHRYTRTVPQIMSRNASNLAQRGTDRREVHDDDRTGQLLTILQDQDCREIMAETKERTVTANEISEHCDIALSTTYRKLNQLVDAGIVEERIRLSLQNRQTREYSLRIETFNLNVTGEDGMLLTLRAD